ncbi:MAG TPA: hypothetical protein VGQ81_01975 [Acidobacteriota bacterium]|nr:hypothetical protein [Acidobacteriota bacterium]
MAKFILTGFSETGVTELKDELFCYQCKRNNQQRSYIVDPVKKEAILKRVEIEFYQKRYGDDTLEYPLCAECAILLGLREL